METYKTLLPSLYEFKLGYIILNLPRFDISSTLKIDSETLYAKEKFHMSILGVKNYVDKFALKNNVSIEKAEYQIVKEAGKILSKNPINFSGFRNEIRLVEESDKKTIAVMCQASGLDSFFRELNNTLNIKIDTQPIHSTIYTRKDGRGIGMINKKELSEFSRHLTENEIIIAKKALNWGEINKF